MQAVARSTDATFSSSGGDAGAGGEDVDAVVETLVAAMFAAALRSAELQPCSSSSSSSSSSNGTAEVAGAPAEVAAVAVDHTLLTRIDEERQQGMQQAPAALSPRPPADSASGPLPPSTPALHAGSAGVSSSSSSSSQPQEQWLLRQPYKHIRAAGAAVAGACPGQEQSAELLAQREAAAAAVAKELWDEEEQKEQRQASVVREAGAGCAWSVLWWKILKSGGTGNAVPFCMVYGLTAAAAFCHLL